MQLYNYIDACGVTVKSGHSLAKGRTHMTQVIRVLQNIEIV